jgi:hypothetical protein
MTGLTISNSFGKLILSFGILGLTACATTSPASKTETLIPSSGKTLPVSAVNMTTDHFQFGDLSSSAWVSETFTGEHKRQFQEKTLHFNVDQSHAEGGLDVGVSRADYDPVTVSKAKTNLKVCSTYKIDLSGEGRWWAGPKVSVNWQGDEAAKQNGDDWYENYIVEIASSTPDELHAIYTGDYFKGEELPSTTLAGSTYRHYKIRFHSWWQFWSVRQDYRETGTLPIEPILDVWIEHGLPTKRVFDGVKANIETYGPIEGRGQLRMDMTQDPSKDLSCE